MLNAQFGLAVHLCQVILENCFRDIDRGEDVRDQADHQCNRETADRAGSKKSQKRRGNDSRYVRIDNGQKSFVETRIYSRSGRLAIAQFFADAFEDQHVGVNAHADGEDDAGNPWQRQNSARQRHERQQNHQVQQQRHDGVGAGKPVVKNHEQHDHDQAECRSLHTVANGIRAERRPNSALFQILDGSRQRTSAQHQRQVMRRFLTKVAFYHAVVVDSPVDHRCRINAMLQYDRQLTAFVLLGEGSKAVRGFRGENKIYLPLARIIGVARFRSVLKVAAGYNRRPAYQVPHLSRFGSTTGGAGFVSTGHQFRAWGENSVVGGQSLRLCGVTSRIFNQSQFELSSSLNDGFGASRITFTRQLHQDFVFVTATQLDGGFSQSQFVDATRNRFD